MVNFFFDKEEKLDKVISPRIITSPHSASTRPMLIQEKIEKIASPVSTEETLNEEKTDEAENDKILIVIIPDIYIFSKNTSIY